MSFKSDFYNSKKSLKARFNGDKPVFKPQKPELKLKN